MHRNISYKIIIFENATYILYRLSFQTFKHVCVKHVIQTCLCLFELFFSEIYILFMIYRLKYILLGCLKHSLPCSIQQTTSQCCDNTWFPRRICTWYNHHLHHHRCKKWGGIWGTFWVCNLVFFGRGFSKQGNAVHKIRCKYCKVFKLFFASGLKIIYIKKADICLIILIQIYLNTISNYGFAKKS